MLRGACTCDGRCGKGIAEGEGRWVCDVHEFDECNECYNSAREATAPRAMSEHAPTEDAPTDAEEPIKCPPASVRAKIEECRECSRVFCGLGRWMADG